MSGSPCISLEGIAKRFGKGAKSVVALEGISVEIASGRITGLVGPDGAGKTTLLRIVTGLLRPDAGRVTVLGLDPGRQQQELASWLGYMPQRFGLYEDLTVAENLELYADLQGAPKSARAARFSELLHMAGLASFTDRLAGRLSGGMKQKLGLVCTLLGRPRLLLLDEPTVGVDPLSRRELWAILFRLREEMGLSIFVSTSYLEEAELCQQVILLSKGKLLSVGEPAAIAARAAGRTFRVESNGLGPRPLHSRLARIPGILSSSIEGSGVRVLMADGSLVGRLEASGLGGYRAEPAAPRFSDGFLAALGEKQEGRNKSRAPGTASMDHPARAGEEMIVVRDLSRFFGTFEAVKKISFQVRAGEVFGLLGPNGAGKSTTFRMLCGLLPPSSGVARVAGVDLRTGAASARARIGYVAQKFSLYGSLTVRQNMQFFARAYGLSPKAQTERIGWAEEEFELAPYRDASAEELPLGFKQRLALACALLHEPDVLFLDEPTSGMDPFAREELWLRIGEMAQKGVTVLITTHHLEEAEFCDRLIIIAEGRILAEGTPGDIKAPFRTAQTPEPSMEEAFVRLIERSRGEG
ncbi:putative transporter fused subunits of ABC superfamily: ATP-binding components [Methylacidimicrobium sp. AP8]|uniref:ATP-binding cassette domain-containing protein n=1 Tax=Methylacidimicrobium sp. AP8 TaxID=2730359 RepID=UPI0018C0B2DF|nr:ATP-binding cassette domain-containing protein [Methylacidimicrobium sp. AP8]CAB4242891.1 putative transporter fused subunits of ABC superfamily: ATP-binding components [Methylacidimicrobium sp. AP8]